MKKIYTAILTALLTIATYAQSPHAARLYGMTQYGSYYKKGSLFHYTPSTNAFITDHNFQIKAKGRTPKCEIITGNNGKFYGTTTDGGDYNAGVLFEWDSITSGYKDIYNFTGMDGKDARGGMVLYNNKLYGTTNLGGANNSGVIYEYDITANAYTKKIDLDSATGRNPTGSMIVLNNIFYGFTSSGGAHNKGVLFQWDPTTNIYTKKFDFTGSNGRSPLYNNLIEISGVIGVKEYVNKKSILVYPNQSIGLFTIELKIKARVIITDVLGKNIYDQWLDAGKQKVDIQDQLNGVYFVNVQEVSGNTFTDKIIISK